MNHQGHGLALDHPIFNTPNAVSFPIAKKAPREKQHEGLTSPLYPDGMGETFDLVNFEIDQPKDAWNPTPVSHEGFFTDVPGFENIAEGHSAKMLGSLALARQGRYFYWGFSIDPERMTAPAADTLENAIHYMHGKRNSRTVPFVCKTRKTLWVYLELNKQSGYLRGIEEHFLGSVQPDSRTDYEPTPAGLKRWLDENLEYVFSGKNDSHRGERYKTIFEVDQDAKALGTPNVERASLEQWIKLATSDNPNRAVGQRLLQRYVHPDIAPEDIDDGPDWDEWYNRHRDGIVFVQSAGYWWMEDPTQPAADGVR